MQKKKRKKNHHADGSSQHLHDLSGMHAASRGFVGAAHLSFAVHRHVPGLI
jgi:hypothetical protein